MPTIRSKETYASDTYSFTKEMLIVCPRCEGEALARRIQPDKKKAKEVLKLTCPNCGYSKQTDSPILKVPLWLTIECGGHMIWACNYEHLALIEKHIEATLRERNTVKGNTNRSVGSRLPRWMSSKKSREKVLKCIQELKHKES